MFFVNAYENNVKKLYDQYDALIRKRELAASTSVAAQKRLSELRLVRRRIAETMLLMERMIYFVTSKEDLRKIKEACGEQEVDWVRMMSGIERQKLETSEAAVSAEETPEERNGRVDPFTVSFDYCDIPKVYDGAVTLAYYSLLHYIKVKIRYWKGHDNPS